MDIGIPKEIMIGESRVALTPDACLQLIKAGHTLHVQTGAGEASGYPDEHYALAGARIVNTNSECYQRASLIIKVKQPLEQDLAQLHNHHTVFSYFHLAADPQLIKQLCAIGMTAIPFESVAGEDGQLPLLAPMSTIAGRIAAIRGANLLFKNRGGRGVLLGGTDSRITDIDDGNVVVLGAGIAGSSAVATAAALGANIIVFDLDTRRLADLKQRYPAVDTRISTADEIAATCVDADIVIGAVLIAGRRAPVLVHESTVIAMHAGSVIIDIAIDQGGCVENIHPTDSNQLFYLNHGVLHSAVPNMPAAVPRTASQALSSAVMSHVLQLASGDLCPALQNAVAISAGEIVDPVLQEEIRH